MHDAEETEYLEHMPCSPYVGWHFYRKSWVVGFSLGGKDLSHLRQMIQRVKQADISTDSLY